MDKKYLVISRSEDEVYNHFYTRSELEMALNEEWKEGYNFVDTMPDDFMYFPANTVFIMYGEIVIPKAKKVVTKLTI